MLVGYMRVSTDGDRQFMDLQRDALLAAGVDERHLFEDHAMPAAAGEIALVSRKPWRFSGRTIAWWYGRWTASADRCLICRPGWADLSSAGSRFVR